MHHLSFISQFDGPCDDLVYNRLLGKLRSGFFGPESLRRKEADQYAPQFGVIIASFGRKKYIGSHDVSPDNFLF